MKNIVFFDGHCSLCNGLVDWLIKRDHRGVLQFASLQGTTAREVIKPEAGSPIDKDTVIYAKDGRLLERSDAILEVLSDLGGLWVGAKVFRGIPRVVRDWGYKKVASNRYRIFGRRETCRMPSPEERGRLLP